MLSVSALTIISSPMFNCMYMHSRHMQGVGLDTTNVGEQRCDVIGLYAGIVAQVLLDCKSSQGVGLDAMNAGEQPVIGLTDTYTQPGVYTLEIPCPRTRSTATIHIEMMDEVCSSSLPFLLEDISTTDSCRSVLSASD